MKKMLKIVALLSVRSVILQFSNLKRFSALYTRSNGTYVAPHLEHHLMALLITSVVVNTSIQKRPRNGAFFFNKMKF